MPRSRNPLFPLLSMLMALTGFPDNALSATTWTGPDTQLSSWFTAGNWDDGLPTSQDVIFNDQAGAVISGGDASTRSIYLTGGYFDPNILISNGGTLDADNAYLATGGTARYGHITVRDPGSTFSVTTAIIVGWTGHGAMTIENGGRVESRDFSLGNNAGSFGLATVTGAGSTLSVDHYLDVGLGGSGTLIIKNGGTVSALDPDGIWLANSAASAGEIIIGQGEAAGVLNTPSIFGNAGDARVTLSHNNSTTFSLAADLGGSLVLRQAGAGTTIYTGTASHTGGTIIQSGTLQIGNGGTSGVIGGNISNSAALVVNRSGRLNITGIISGNGTFRQAGPGTTVLNGAQTFSGATTVESGTLLVNGSLFSAVVVQSNGTLGGGALLGSVTMQEGATISPGDNSVGSMTMSTLTLQGMANVLLELGTTSDAITTTNLNLTSDGRISFTLDDATGALSDGETFRLLSYTSASGLQLTDLGYEYIGTQGELIGSFALVSGGIDFTIMSIPEPTISGLMAFGLVMLAGRRRKCESQSGSPVIR